MFEEKLSEKLYQLKGKKVLTAFSGGKDSSALLDFLKKNSEKYSFNLAACHINHGIRGNFASRDENFCREYCKNGGIEYYPCKVNVPEYVSIHKTSVEAAARTLRINALLEIKQINEFDIIVTAHHFDDLVETFFVKVFQGGAITNLKGFSYDDTVFCRPMLDITSQEIMYYIEKNNIEYVEDETNFSNDFTRNWVRSSIIPVIRGYNESYLRNIRQLQSFSAEMKDYFSKKCKDINISEEYGVYEIDYRQLVSLEPVEIKFLLSRFLSELFRCEKKHIDSCLKIILDKGSKRIFLPNKFVMEKSYDKVRVFKGDMLKSIKIVKKCGEDIVFIPNLCKIARFDRVNRDRELIIRNREDGDRLFDKKIKDLFIDKKIDLFIRDTSVVVEMGEKVIFVEHLSKNNCGISIERGEKSPVS